MDEVIQETWKKLKENIKAKREAQKDYRDERAASEELVRRYTNQWKELEYYKSNKHGLIERKKYNDLETQYKELTEQYEH